MPRLTVRTLAEDPALGLRLLAGAAAADRTIEGAHTSDLDHPARYLLPGELVLTNGLWTEHVDGDRWAAEVNTAGGGGGGLGVAAHPPAGAGGPRAGGRGAGPAPPPGAQGPAFFVA